LGLLFAGVVGGIHTGHLGREDLTGQAPILLADGNATVFAFIFADQAPTGLAGSDRFLDGIFGG